MAGLATCVPCRCALPDPLPADPQRLCGMPAPWCPRRSRTCPFEGPACTARVARAAPEGSASSAADGQGDAWKVLPLGSATGSDTGAAWGSSGGRGSAGRSLHASGGSGGSGGSGARQGEGALLQTRLLYLHRNNLYDSRYENRVVGDVALEAAAGSWAQVSLVRYWTSAQVRAPHD